MPEILGTSKNIWNFDPRSIPGCLMWLEPTQFTGTGSSTVWADRSGNGYNMSYNASYTSPPTLNTTTPINGNNVVSFTGTTGCRLTGTITFPRSERSIFIVLRPTGMSSSVAADISLLGPLGASGYLSMSLQPYTGTTPYYWFMTNTGSFFTMATQSATLPTVNNVCMLAAVNATSTASNVMTLNGITQTLDTANNVASFPGGAYTQYLGGGASGTKGNWDCCEMIFYSSALSIPQRQQVEGYLAWKWGIECIPQANIVPSISPLNLIPGNPTDIPGCVLWLDAADTQAMTLSGSNVTTWIDKSGLSNNATSYNTPVLTANAINGKQAISTSNLPYFTGSVSVTGTTVTVFAVATTTRSLPNSSSDQRLVSLVNGANVDYGRTDGVIGLFNQGSSSWIGTWRVSGPIATNTIVTNTPFIAVSKYNGTNGFLWLNGTAGSLPSSASSGTFAVTKYGIGNQANPTSEYWQGFIGEVIVYTTALSDTQRKQIEGYLGRKWGIITPPDVSINSIPSTACQVWLDGSDPNGNGIKPSNGATVSTWVDKSGNGYNATVASSRIGGTYNTASNCVYFQASNVGYVTSYPANPTSETMFVVFNNPTPSFNNNIIIGGQQGARSLGAGYSGLAGIGSTQVVGNLNNEVAWLAATTTATSGYYLSNTTAIVTSQFTSSSNSISLNGGTVSSGGAPGFSNSTTTYLGVDTTTTSYYYLGYVMEIIFYKSVLTDSQRQQIQAYLITKWGVGAYKTGYTPLLNSPTNIPGCVLWLDASDSSTITLSSGNMTQWADKSGVGNTMTPYSTYSNVTVSSGFQNGLNVLNFSGGGIYRTSASSAVYPLDMYAVVALKDLTTAVDVLGVGATSTDNFNSLTFSEYTTGRWHNGSTGFSRTPNCVSPTNETVSNSLVLIQWSIADSNYLLRRNGIQLVQTSSYTFTLTAGSVFQLGLRYPNFTTGAPSNPFRGYIGEILIFSNVLNTTQRQSVERYLSIKWGLSNFYTSIPGSISGLQLWLDGADTSTMTFPSTSNISGWKDKATLGFTVSNLNSGYYPTYVTGLGVYLSNPSSTSQATCQSMNYNTAWYVPTQNMTMFIAYKATSTDNLRAPVLIGGGAGFTARPNFAFQIQCGAGEGTNSLWDLNAGSWSLNVTNNSNTSTGLRVESLVSTPGATSGFNFINGIESVYSTNTSPYTSTYTNFPAVIQIAQGSLIGNRIFNGYIQEILFYSNALSSNERSVIQGYLAKKWGNTSIPTEVLPLTHPFTSFPPLMRTFNPIDVPGCILWLDAMDQSTLNGGTITDGTGVTLWSDKSGLGNSASTTTTNKPTWSSACNALQFVYTNSNGIGGLLNTTYSNDTTVFVVMSYTYISPYTNAAYPRFFNMSSNPTYPNTSALYHLYGQLNLMFEYPGYSNPPYAWTANANGPNSASGYTYACVYFPSPSSNTNPTGLVSGTNLAIANAITVNTSGNGKPFIYTNASSWNGSTLTLNTFSNDYQSAKSTYSGGVTTGSTSYGANYNQYAIGNYPGLNAGASDCFNGYINEIVVYSNVLSSNQIQLVQQYLARKWNIYSATPSNGNTASNFTPSNIIYAASGAQFSPTNITNCALWLDAANPNEFNTFSFISGSNVNIWYDKSGNGNHATASGSYPTYSYASNCVVWNGTSGSQLVLNTAITTSIVNKAFTIFVVSQRTVGSENFFMRGTNSANNSNLLIGHGGPTPATSIRFAFYGNDMDYTSVPTYTAGEPPSIICFQYSKPNRAIYYNGMLGTSDTNSTDLASWTGAMVGGGGGTWLAYQGKIFEIIIYGAVLTTVQRQQVEGYLAWKWGLVSRLTSFTTSGLAYHLDAGNTASYSGSGTTWTDLTGTGVAMTLVNGPSFSSAVGGCIVFTPGSSHYAATATEFQSSAYTNWTIEVWMSPTNTYTGTNPAIVTQKYPSTVNYVLGASAGISAPNIGVGFYNGNWYYIPTGYAATANVWAQFVGTYDGANLKLHVNGTLVQSNATTATATWANNGGIYLMRRWDGAEYLGGSLAIIRIYRRALTNDEIKTNFNAQRGRFSI